MGDIGWQTKRMIAHPSGPVPTCRGGQQKLPCTGIPRGLESAFQEEESEAAVGRIMTTFAISWALLPAVVGGAWCYRYWLPALRGPGSNNPNPLGKALKSRQW